VFFFYLGHERQSKNKEITSLLPITKVAVSGQVDFSHQRVDFTSKKRRRRATKDMGDEARKREK